MFDVLMNLIVRVEKEQDRNGDEGEFQIAAVTVVRNRVNVELHQISLGSVPRSLNTQSGDPLFGATDRPGLDVHVATISEQNPYFAYAIRAVEFDNSSDSMREGDRNSFVGNIRQEAQRVVDGRGLPTVNTIWLAGHNVELLDRRTPSGILGWFTPWRSRDDDDRIGVSARTYPDLGTIFATDNPVIPVPRPGVNIPGSSQWTELLFSEENARWRMAAGVAGRWSD